MLLLTHRRADQLHYLEGRLKDPKDLARAKVQTAQVPGGAMPGGTGARGGGAPLCGSDHTSEVCSWRSVFLEV